MANYNILVHNKSGATREYVLFKEEPRPSLTPGKTVFQNAYVTSKSVPHDTGSGNFQIKTIFNAVTGISSDAVDTNGIKDVPKIDSSTNASRSNSQSTNSTNTTAKSATTAQVAAQICQNEENELVLGSAANVRVVEGKPKFEPQEPPLTCNVDGSFSISIDGSLELLNADNVFVGFSASDPYDNASVTSVSSIPAQPNTTNIITPISKYYISWGAHVVSDTIQASTIGKPALVEFTGKKSDKADVVHNSDGTWTVTYD